MLDLTNQRTAAGGGVVLVLRFGVGAVLNYGFSVVLAWVLAPSRFGTVSVLQNVLLMCSALLTAGFPWALAGAIAQAQTHHDIRAVYRSALVGNLGLGLVLALAVVGVQLTHGLLPDASVVLVAATALTIAVLSLNTTLAGALQGERRFDGLGVMQTVEIGVKVVVALALVGLLSGTVDGVALGFLAGALTATAIGLRALRDRLPGRGPMSWRTTTPQALSMGIATSTFGIILTVDVIALSVIGRGHAVTASAVAIYQAAAVLARAPHFVADALSNAVFPFIAKAREAAEVSAWFFAAYRWVPLALVPAQMVLLIAPGPVLELFFPATYGQAAGIIRILTVGTFGLLTSDMLLKGLNARGLSAAVARRVPAALAVEVVALLILVPLYGTTGAAVAFVAGSWTGAGLLAQLFLRRYPPPQLRPGLVVRYLLAAAPLVTLLAAASFARQTPALVAIAVGLALYGVGAVRLRLVRAEDVARATAVVQRLRRGREVRAS